MNKTIKHQAKQISKYLISINRIDHDTIWEEVEITVAEQFPDIRDNYEIVERMYDEVCKILKV